MKRKAIVTVRGGLVESFAVNDNNVEVEVLDYDNLEDEVCGVLEKEHYHKLEREAAEMERRNRATRIVQFTLDGIWEMLIETNLTDKEIEGVVRTKDDNENLDCDEKLTLYAEANGLLYERVFPEQLNL